MARSGKAVFGVIQKSHKLGGRQFERAHRLHDLAVFFLLFLLFQLPDFGLPFGGLLRAFSSSLSSLSILFMQGLLSSGSLTAVVGADVALVAAVMVGAQDLDDAGLAASSELQPRYLLSGPQLSD